MTILLFKPKYTQPLFIWKFEHFLFYVSFSFSFSVYILFWIAFHITEVPLSKQTAWYMGNAALRHDCVLVILYIELFLNNILFKWKHLIIPSLSIAVYIAFNWQISLKKGPIYKILDWKSRRSNILLGLTLTFIFINFLCGKVVCDKVKAKRIRKNKERN